MAINPSDISPIKGTTYYVNVEPTQAELAMFPLPVTFKIVSGNSFRIVSYKADGERLELAQTDKHYIHQQSAPNSLWVIDHPLNKKVSVTIVDTANNVIEGAVSINDGNRVIIEFNAPFSGEALLN